MLAPTRPFAPTSSTPTPSRHDTALGRPMLGWSAQRRRFGAGPGRAQLSDLEQRHACQERDGHRLEGLHDRTQLLGDMFDLPVGECQAAGYVESTASEIFTDRATHVLAMSHRM